MRHIHLISINIYNRITWNNITEMYDAYSRYLHVKIELGIISGWKFYDVTSHTTHS